MVQIRPLNDLLANGAKFFGKVAKNGSACLVNELEGGAKLYTTIDKDMNIIKQAKRIPIKDGHRLEIFNANGALIREGESTFVETDLGYFGRNITKNYKHVGPKGSMEMKIGERTTEYRWAKDATRKPYLEVGIKMLNPEESGTIRKYVRKNVVTGEIERAEAKNFSDGKRTDSYFATAYNKYGALEYCDMFGFKSFFNIPGHIGSSRYHNY